MERRNRGCASVLSAIANVIVNVSASGYRARAHSNIIESAIANAIVVNLPLCTTTTRGISYHRAVAAVQMLRRRTQPCRSRRPHRLPKPARGAFCRGSGDRIARLPRHPTRSARTLESSAVGQRTIGMGLANVPYLVRLIFALFFPFSSK